MKQYGMTLLVAISLLVATPRVMGAQSKPVSHHPTAFSSTTILSQTPPASSNASVELIKIIGGNVFGVLAGFIGCLTFYYIGLPDIRKKIGEKAKIDDKKRVKDLFLALLNEDQQFKSDFQNILKDVLVGKKDEEQKKLFEYCLFRSFEDSKSKKEFQNKLRELFVINEYELGTMLFENCLITSLGQFIEHTDSKSTLNSQLDKIIEYYFFSERSRIGLMIGQMREDIQRLQEPFSPTHTGSVHRGDHL